MGNTIIASAVGLCTSDVRFGSEADITGSLATK